MIQTMQYEDILLSLQINCCDMDSVHNKHDNVPA